jgi:hypothetical protein
MFEFVDDPQNIRRKALNSGKFSHDSITLSMMVLDHVLIADFLAGKRRQPINFQGNRAECPRNIT